MTAKAPKKRMTPPAGVLPQQEGELTSGQISKRVGVSRTAVLLRAMRHPERMPFRTLPPNCGRQSWGQPVRLYPEAVATAWLNERRHTAKVARARAALRAAQAVKKNL